MSTRFPSRSVAHIVHDAPVAGTAVTEAEVGEQAVLEESEPFEGDEFTLTNCQKILADDESILCISCTMQIKRDYDDGSTEVASLSFQCKGPWKSLTDEECRAESVMGAKAMKIARHLAYIVDQRENAPVVVAVKIDKPDVTGEV